MADTRRRSMSRLSVRDEKQLRDIVAESQLLHLGGASVFSRILKPLGELLRADLPLAYSLRSTDQGPRVDVWHWGHAESSRNAHDVLDRAFVTTPTGPGAYRPLRPEPWQQNRVVTLDRALKAYPQPKIYSQWREVGLAGADQLRVLLCHRGTLLAWVGVYRPESEPFGAREQDILQRLVPALLRRLSLDRQLATAPMAHAALEAVINALPSPAWVADATGRVHFANRLGLDQLEQRRGELAGDLRAAIARPGSWQAQALGDGVGWLVIQPLPQRSPLGRLAVLGPRWNLTPREAEVLGQLSQGLSNREIATRLCCGERTIEVHVTRALAKAGASNRSELVARFWTEPMP
jgi:DNA-binding CsgD family transcriptional regulator/PAS domain-containing protein